MTSKDFIKLLPDEFNLNVDDLRQHAQTSINSGRYQDAIESLELVTRMVPDHSAAWNDLGVAYLLNGSC